MKANNTLHVLTDSKGKIIGAAFLGAGSGQSGEVRTQVLPLKGQTVVEVALTAEHGKLESDADFRRFATEFHLPRGARALARKGVSAGKKRPSPAKKKRRKA